MYRAYTHYDEVIAEAASYDAVFWMAIDQGYDESQFYIAPVPGE